MGRIVSGLARRGRESVRAARATRVRLREWLRFQAGRRDYRFLSQDELRASRTSETLFVFGSGWSLNEIPAEEWAHFEQHQTLGFNWFVRQGFVRTDYHLVRGIGADDLRPESWRPAVEGYFRLARENPRFRSAIFVVHTGFNAINGNRGIGLRLLPADRPVFLYRSKLGQAEFSWSFSGGLAHPNSTLEDAVNFAVLAGWTRIVLVGVDLYDRRYFWLGRDETRPEDVARGASHEEPHSRAATGMVATFGAWRAMLEPRGIELSVYNRRSLLADVLPVYRPQAAGARTWN
jgi:hypothetical protein